MDWKSGLAVAAAILSIGADPAPKPATGAAPMAAAPAPAKPPYLGAALPDSYAILPPAPVAGTVRYEADRSIYRSTRALKDSPRWALAQNDVNQFALLKDLSCAVGVEPPTGRRTSTSVRDPIWSTTARPASKSPPCCRRARTIPRVTMRGAGPWA